MDEIKINELYLYTINTGDLYRKVAQPIMDNLAKKIANGTYDKTKALIAWQRLADQGAARYDREINDGRGSMMWIPKKEREEVAKMIQEHYEEELQEKAEKLKAEKGRKSSLRKPVGRFVKTEKKASVLSRRALLRHRASIRRRAEKDWFSLEEKVERYLKENGFSPMVKLWEVDYMTVQGTDKDNISYQFTFDKNGNICMEYMGGAYTFENTNEPITMAQALGEFGLNPSGISENGSKYWFASQENAEETDCGTGTFDLLEALDWLSFMKEQGNTEVRICVCSEKSDFCEGEITTDDIY